MLVALVLLVLRVLCLSLIFLLIYSGSTIITFIFVLMTFDQSDIHCIPSYKFIPVLVLYLEGFIPMVAYEIWQHGLASALQQQLSVASRFASRFASQSSQSSQRLKETTKLYKEQYIYFLVGLSAPMVHFDKEVTLQWRDCLILENEVSVLDDVLYADLNGYFLVVGCTLFISLVNCLSIFNKLDFSI